MVVYIKTNMLKHIKLIKRSLELIKKNEDSKEKRRRYQCCLSTTSHMILPKQSKILFVKKKNLI